MRAIDLLRMIYLAADVVLILLAAKAVMKKTTLGVYVGQTIFAGAAVITFYTLSIFTSNYFYVSLYNSMTFVSIDIMLLLLVRYMMFFCRLQTTTKEKARKIVTAGIVSMEILVLMLNPFKEIAISYEKFELNGVTLYHYVPKAYFIFHLCFCYLLVVIGIGVLIYKIRITPRMYRSRYSNTLISFLVVVLVNFLFLSGAKYLNIDLSYILYALMAISMYVSSFMYKDRFIMSNRNELFQGMGIPILMFDYEQNLCDYNDRGKSIFNFIKEEQNLSLDEFLQNANIKLKSVYSNETFTYKIVEEDVEKIYRTEYICYKENAGKLSASMFVFHDITKEQEIIEEEKRINRTKTNFLMNMSCGIKRPLHDILQSTNQLLLEQLDTDHHQRIEGISDSTKVAISLIDDLMDYSMLESGHYEVHKETVNVAECVGYIEERISKFTKEFGVDIQLEVDDFLPYQIVSNLDRLKQIGDTLIRNAVENADGKAIRVLIYYSEEGLNHGTLNLEATDRGPGISKQMLDNLKHLLEMPAEDVDNAAIREGLELYMISRMARFMGGNVEVNADETRGNVVHAYVHVDLEQGTEYMKMKK